jgi:hypothetical protein
VTVLRPDGRRETVVSVEGASLPITMSWKAQPGSTGVAISGNGGFRQLLEGEGSIEVTAADLIPGSGPAGGDESRRELRLVSGGTPADAVPTDFSVAQNYPNPFNGTTVVSFSLPEDGSAVVEVFDMLGERVLEVGRRDYGAGTHYVSIDADPLPSGVYFYRMTASSADRTWRSGTMKLILLK